MSLDRKDYLMLAVNINDKHIDFYDEENEKFLPYIEGHRNVNLRIVEDVMSGEFCFFGKVLKVGEDYDGFDTSPIEISDAIIKSQKSQIADKYFELFNEQINENDIKLYCFTKYW
jgi:hypothetical protein